MAIDKVKFFHLFSQHHDHGESTKGQEHSHEKLVNDPAKLTGEQVTGPTQGLVDQVVENVDPHRRRIRKPGRGTIRRMMKFAFGFLAEPKKATPEQIAEKREKKAREEMKKVITQDAKTAMHWMVGAFDRLGICFIRYDSEGKIRKFNHVKFDEVRMEPDAIHVHIDMHKLPFGVDILSLRDASTIDNLAASVGRAVSCTWTP